MKFSIVIPTHFRHKLLIEALSSIESQAYDLNQVEVLIVSNLSDPFFKTSQFENCAPELIKQVLVVGAEGVNKARNLGIKSAAGNLIFLLDDDCELHGPQFLSNLEELHERNPEAIAIGGTYTLDENADPVDRAYNCVARQWQSLDHYGDYQSTRLVGGNVSYKKAMLLSSSQWFDESIVFGGTEAEFHQRLSERGYLTLCFPSLEVLHRTSLTSELLVRKAYLQAQGHVKYKITKGFSEKASRTYQNKRLLLARSYSRDEKEFGETVSWMNLYDWAYQYSCENPDVRVQKVFSKSKNWLREQKRENPKGAR